MLSGSWGSPAGPPGFGFTLRGGVIQAQAAAGHDGGLQGAVGRTGGVAEKQNRQSWISGAVLIMDDRVLKHRCISSGLESKSPSSII